MEGASPLCMVCAHLDREDDQGLRCRAFPGGVPARIYMNRHDHRRPDPEDGGFQFEPMPDLHVTELQRRVELAFGQR